MVRLRAPTTAPEPAHPSERRRAEELERTRAIAERYAAQADHAVRAPRARRRAARPRPRDRRHAARADRAADRRAHAADPRDVGAAGALPRPAGRPGGRDVHDVQAADPEAGRGGPPRPVPGLGARPAHGRRAHARRALAADDAARRAAAAVERRARRHVARRPAPDPPGVLRAALRGDPAVLAAVGRAPGADGLRPAAHGARHVVGREARPRPRVARRPVRRALPAVDRRHRVPGAPARGGRPRPRCGAHSHVRDLRHRSPSTAGRSTRAPCARWPTRSCIAGRTARALFADGPVALATGAWRSSTSPTATSRCATRTGRSPWCRTARSTSTVRCGRAASARGHRFASRCDTEVLPTLYEECGAEFARAAARDVRDRAVGRARAPAPARPRPVRDQAALLPRRRRRAVVRLGLKALRGQPGFRGELDPEALEAYLAFNTIPAPLSIYRDVRKLPPGTCSRRAPGRVEVRRYARPAPVAAGAVRREPARRARRRAARAVARLRRAHLVSDVPVGVFLSGGIDSRARGARRAGDRGPRAHVLGRLRGALVRRAARARGRRAVRDRPSRARPARPTPPRSCPRSWPPSTSPSGLLALPTYAVSRLAAGHVKVALSGEGGDELFGGYFTYVADVLAPRSRPRAAPGSRGRWSSACRARRGASPRVQGQALRPRRGAAAARAPSRLEGDLLARRAGGLLGPRRAGPTRSTGCARATPRPRAPSPRPAAGRRHGHLPRRRPAREDRPREHGPLARGPRAVLDPVVAELALALPTAEGPRRSRRSGCCAGPRSAAAAARDRPRAKRGFSIPAAAWLRGELRPSRATCCPPTRCAGTASSDPDAVSGCSTSTSRAREDHSRALWGLLLSLWRQTAAGRRTSARSGVPLGR